MKRYVNEPMRSSNGKGATRTPDGTEVDDDRGRSREDLLEEIGELRRRVVELEITEVKSRTSRDTHKISEERLAEAQRIARIGNWEWDVQGNEVHWSAELYRIFGLTPGEFEATYEAFLERAHPEDRPYIRDHIEATLTRDIPYLIHFRIMRPNGSIRFLQAEGQLERSDTGEPVRLVGTCQDVTERTLEEMERRQLESQLYQARRMESLAILAGGLATDFDNLLLTIAGNADLAALDLPPDSPVHARLRQIHQAVDQAVRLTQNLQAYAGTAELDDAPVDLNALLQESTDALDRSISIKATIHYRLGSHVPEFSGGRDQIRQVIMALVANAAEAIGDRRGSITIGTGVLHVDSAYLASAYVAEELQEGPYVYLRVEDTGCGMDPETKAQVFDPFYSTKGQGRGLGLTAVHGIVRSHGGAVAIESELDRGTTCTVLLPVLERATHGCDGDPVPWRGTGTVLVVDDDPSVRSVVKLLVERRGFRVITARDGREGVDLFERLTDDIRVVLLDLHTPRMKGDQALGELRRMGPETPVILLSGSADRSLANRVLADPRVRILSKPFQAAALIDVLHDVLDPVSTSQRG